MMMIVTLVNFPFRLKSIMLQKIVIGLIFVPVLILAQTQRYDPEHFERITRPEVYKNHIEPKPDPVDVEVSLKLLNFGSIDEKQSNFFVTVQIYLTWLDERLALNSSSNDLSPLDIGQWHLTRIWTPAIHFSNSDPFTADILSDKLSGQITGLIDNHGRVSVVKRCKLSLQCNFNLRFYPMDTQRCSISIEPSRLSTAGMHLKWRHLDGSGPIHIGDHFKWSNFALKRIWNETGRINYQDHGPYQRLTVKFSLQRHVEQYLFTVYLPSTLFIITSWSGFWIHITGAPARVALALTTMLTHITSTKSIRDQLPKSSPITALDVWILMGTMFIFASIIEYSMANYFYYKPLRIQDKKSPETGNSNRTDRNGNLDNSKSYWHRAWRTVIPPFDGNDDESSPFHPRRIGLQMDHFSRYIFPLTFIAFNAIYWIILATRTDDDDDGQ